VNGQPPAGAAGKAPAGNCKPAANSATAPDRSSGYATASMPRNSPYPLTADRLPCDSSPDHRLYNFDGETLAETTGLASTIGPFSILASRGAVGARRPHSRPARNGCRCRRQPTRQGVSTPPGWSAFEGTETGAGTGQAACRRMRRERIVCETQKRRRQPPLGQNG
jgi:hypothetical protein